MVESFEDGYLLVSRYILDGMPWDDGSGDGSVLNLKTEITYEQCSIRRWIRDSFSVEAFTEEERSLIIPVSVKGDDVLAEQAKIVTVDTAGRFSNSVVTETLGFRPAIYVVYN